MDYEIASELVALAWRRIPGNKNEPIHDLIQNFCTYPFHEMPNYVSIIIKYPSNMCKI
jgi:hypothetical protein